jgi:hypothetical protein
MTLLTEVLGWDRAWSGFLDAAKTGKPSVKATLGTDSAWDYYETHPHEQKVCASSSPF